MNNGRIKFQALLRQQWPYILLLTILSILVLWIFFPGNRVESSFIDSEKKIKEEEIILEQKKESLINEVKALDKALSESTCVGDRLKMPDQSEIELFLPPRISTNPEINELVTVLDESVVLVSVFSLEDSEKAGHGSGFSISSNLILTNAHVTGDLTAKNEIFVGNKSIGIQKANLLYSSGVTGDLKDFSVLKISGSIGKPLRFFDDVATSSHKLKTVYASGFPGVLLRSDGNFMSFIEGDDYSFPDLNITNGKVSSQQRFQNKIVRISIKVLTILGRTHHL